MIILGVDGANSDTLLQPAKRGSLPNFSKLLDNGVGGPLRSYTTSSAAAWTCHLTGVSPEDSGVTSFTKNDRFVRTDDIAVRTYPELLDEAGLSVGLINIPLTYPPFKLSNGFCISGQITPVGSTDYAYPGDVQEILNSVNYEIDIQYGDRQYAFVDGDLDISTDQLRQDVIRVESKRIEASKKLMSQRKWDVLFILINGTDPLQHYYWHEMQDRRLEDTSLMEMYSIIDDLVGYIRDEYPEQNILTFSDHGFQRDVWGSSNTSRRRWRYLRDIGSRVFPESLRETALRSWCLELMSKVASVTTTSRGGGNGEQTGDHHPQGVWLLGGPEIKEADDFVPAQFLDLPATILHQIGQPVPERYAGTVNTTILKSDGPVKRESVNLDIDRQQKVDVEMEEQLAHLGYVEMVEE